MLDNVPIDKRRELMGDWFPEELLPLLSTGESDARRRVIALLPDLFPVDQEVITRRLNLDGNGFRTLDEAAAELGKTRAAVRLQQIRGFQRLEELLDAERLGIDRKRYMGKEFPSKLLPLLADGKSELRGIVITLLPQLERDIDRQILTCRLNLDGNGFRSVEETAKELKKTVLSIRNRKRYAIEQLSELIEQNLD